MPGGGDCQSACSSFEGVRAGGAFSGSAVAGEASGDAAELLHADMNRQVASRSEHERIRGLLIMSRVSSRAWWVE